MIYCLLKVHICNVIDRAKFKSIKQKFKLEEEIIDLGSTLSK